MYLRTSFIGLFLFNTFLSNVFCLQCSFKRRNQDALNCSAVMYTGESCISNNLKKIYPDLYGQDLWPEKPYKFELQPFDREHTNGSFFPGIKAIVSAPNTASVLEVKGFEINFKDIKDLRKDAQHCVIIDLRNITLTAADRGSKSNAIVEIYPLERSRTFSFHLYTLPKPPANKIRDDLYHLASVTTRRSGWRPGDPSEQWSTTISFRNISASKEVRFKFTPPPKEYNFVDFDVKLWRIQNPGTRPEKRYKVQSYTINQTSYTFKNVTPGFYRISVSPREVSLVPPHCVCKNGRNRCTNNCITTVTAIFQMKSSVQTSSSHTHTSPLVNSIKFATERREHLENTTGTTEVSPELHKEVPPSDNTVQIVAIATSSVFAALLLCLLIIFLFYRFIRRKKENNNENKDKCCDSEDKVSERYTQNDQHMISQKSVYLVYALDHPLHYNVIETFARFLTKDAYCHVLNFQGLQHRADMYQVILNNIEEADYIFLINSDVAYQQYVAWKKSEKYMGPHTPGDTFAVAYREISKHFIEDPYFYQSVVMINFSYTKEHNEENMGAGRQFELMDDMPELLRYIHDVSYFPDCSRTSEGLALDQAIHSASKKECFLQQNNMSEYWKEHHAPILARMQERFSVAETIELHRLKPLIAEGMREDGVSVAETVDLGTPQCDIQEKQRDETPIGLEIHGLEIKRRKSSDTSDNPFIPPEPSVCDTDMTSYMQQQEILTLNQRNTPFLGVDIQTIVSGISV